MNDRSLRERDHGSRRPSERGSTPDRVRHHRSERDHGARRGRPRPGRPAREARQDHHRPDVRGRARYGGADQSGRRARSRPQGGDQAEPRADARGAARFRPLRPVREHRARQQLARGRPRRALSSASTSSPSRASPRTWGWRSSSTSPAASADLRPSAVVLVATIKALKHHGGSTRRRPRREIEIGAREPRATHRNRQRLRPPGRRRRQQVPDRHAGGARARPRDSRSRTVPSRPRSTPHSRTAATGRPRSRRRSSPRRTSRTPSTSPTRSTRRSRRRSA